MNKITVLKPDFEGEYDNIYAVISGAEASVEITDEEIEDEANKVHKSNGLHGYYIDGYHDGFLAAYEFIKNQINQKQ